MTDDLDPDPLRSQSRTAMHETGHAFDYALAAAAHHASLPISHTTGFQYNFALSGTGSTSDLWRLDHGKSGNQAPQTCAVFGNVAPSALEYDINITPAGGEIAGQICTNNVVNAQLSGKTNSQILIKQEPYFAAPSTQTPPGGTYDDAFAETFKKSVSHATPDILPVIDGVLQTNNLPCIKFVVQTYISTLAPPTTAQLNTAVCPSTGTW